jgi:hypothetical protein
VELFLELKQSTIEAGTLPDKNQIHTCNIILLCPGQMYMEGGAFQLLNKNIFVSTRE